MRRLMFLLITSVLVLATAGMAFESGVPYVGCPKHVPGCPGYEARYEMQISSKGPATITGNPLAQQGRWAQRRDYTRTCYWDADVGLTCMQGGKIPKYQSKRFRRDKMLGLQSDTRERQTDPRRPITTSSGFVGMSGRLGGRFGWRGYAPRLRDVYGSTPTIRSQ